MTDLTVLISPIPLGPEPSSFSFGRRSTRPLNKPIMVTLETEVDEDSEKKSPTESSISEDFLDPPTPHPRRSRTPRVVEPNLLSPPVNTWKSRPKHRPTRSQSAPPERRVAPPRTEGEQEVSETPGLNRDLLGFKPRNPNRSFTSFTVNRQTTQGGELVRPPPPLFRPTTFWRKTPRSGVTGASYSPATHLIRRSTYIAAGLTFDAPIHDLSALSSDCPNDRKSCLSPRQQTPTPTTDPSASTTFDFWWPFPAATIISSGSTTPVSSSQATNSTTLVITVQSSSSNSPTASSVSLTSLPSQTVTSLSLPISNASSKPPFNIIDVIPAISAAGVFLIGLAIWLIYGCCTRRPRIRTDNGELICGPPYRNDDGEHEIPRDVEERGQENELMIPKRGHRKSSGQYRWPSYNELPPFDKTTGFYIPDEYKEPDGDNYLTATLLAPPSEAARRSKSSRTKRSFATPNSKKRNDVGPSSTKSPISDATSVALLELYESDEEKEKHRRATEVPWESLRHKSIKRGILEQAKKENRWMDSIRSSIAGGAAFLSGRESVPIRAKNHEQEEEIKPLRTASEGEVEAQNKVVGKRRSHIRADSDIFLGPADAQTTSVLTAGPSGYLSEPANESLPHTHTTCTLEVHPTVQTPGVRHSFVQLKDDPQDLDKYTPIPTRTTPSRRNSRSRSRSRGRGRNRSDSASPVKRSLHRTNYRPLTATEEYEVGSISRDVLPSSPPQLMSPPLESQICFTPPLRPNELVPSSLFAQVQPKTRMRTTTTSSCAEVSPTKNPSPRKSRKLHSSTPPHLPFPGCGVTIMTSRPDAYRGRLLKKQKSAKGAVLDSFSDKNASGGPSATLHNEGDTECNEAMRKVDRIIQSSWSARDVVE